MLKGVSDIDCVVMVNDLPKLHNVGNMSVYVERDLANANRNIQQAIKDHATVLSTEINKYMVKTTLNVSGVRVDVDLIPTADNLAAQGKVFLWNPGFGTGKAAKLIYVIPISSSFMLLFYITLSVSWSIWAHSHGRI